MGVHCRSTTTTTTTTYATITTITTITNITNITIAGDEHHVFGGVLCGGRQRLQLLS